MMRAISIVLIVTIALQAVGCSTWRPLTCANEVPEDDRQSSMREQVLGKLTEGTRARIKIREGIHAPIKSEVIEGKIETIGPKSLTVIFESDYFRGGEKEKLTLHFSDISTPFDRLRGPARLLPACPADAGRRLPLKGGVIGPSNGLARSLSSIGLRLNNARLRKPGPCI